MFIAYQGANSIENESQLRTQISKLIKSDNLAILFGAGASVDIGGIVMSQVWDKFKEKFEESYNNLIRMGLISNEYEKYNKNNIFGDVIDMLTDIIDKPFKNDYTKVKNSKIILNDLIRILIDAAILDENLWGVPADTLRNSGKLYYHRNILHKLCSSRTPDQSAPWAFTLNYDLALEWAAKSENLEYVNGFSGEGEEKRFTPNIFKSGIESSDELDEINHLNLVKIHGSLTWTKFGSEITELPEQSAKFEIINFLRNRGKTRIPELMILPGGKMFIQTTKSPHKELLSQFENFLNQSNSALFIVGYGHSDTHIDDLIFSALSKNKDLKVIIYFPNFSSMKNTENLPESLKKVIELKCSNVIIVGGWDNACLSNFSSHLEI